MPTSEYIYSELFAAHFAMSGLTHTSIKVYFSTIGNWHSSCSQHEVYHKSLTPCLEQIRRTRPANAHHVYISQLQQISCPGYFQCYLNLQTTARISYCGQPAAPHFLVFLRVGEMTVPSQDTCDHLVHLSLEDVTLDSRSHLTIIWLTIKQSKTDPFRKGAKLCLGCTDSVACPVKAMLPYLAVWGCTPGPLFKLSSGTPLTRPHFRNLFLSHFATTGLDDSLSFRIGAANSAKTVGISDVHIQMLRRWKSLAYQSYIRTPTPVLKRLWQQLVLTPGT